MKASIEKRITNLEQRRGAQARQMHIIKAHDQADTDRQMAQLLDLGAAGLQDGFLCLTGRPLTHGRPSENTGFYQGL